MTLAELFRFPRLPAAPVDNQGAPRDADWSERLVTSVAVSAAVLVVALIAVLMGMAGP